jgi:hypothetical protein
MGSFDNLPSSDDYRSDALRTSRAAFEADGGITGPRPLPSGQFGPHVTRDKRRAAPKPTSDLWTILAQRVTTVDGYTRSSQVPTFSLSGDQLGIVDADHAAKIAADMLKPAPDEALSLSIYSPDEYLFMREVESPRVVAEREERWAAEERHGPSVNMCPGGLALPPDDWRA